MKHTYPKHTRHIPPPYLLRTCSVPAPYHVRIEAKEVRTKDVAGTWKLRTKYVFVIPHRTRGYALCDDEFLLLEVFLHLLFSTRKNICFFVGNDGHCFVFVKR